MAKKRKRNNLPPVAAHPLVPGDRPLAEAANAVLAEAERDEQGSYIVPLIEVEQRLVGASALRLRPRLSTIFLRSGYAVGTVFGIEDLLVVPPPEQEPEPEPEPEPIAEQE